MSVPARAVDEFVDQGVDPRAALDGLPDLVFVLGANGELLDINETAARLLGWSRSAWLGRSVLDLVHPDDVAMAVSSIAVLQDKEMGTPIELRVRRADGGWRWMEVIGSNHLLDGGVAGLLCVARDITQRRMWEVAGGDAARLQQIVQHSPSITMLIDGEGTVSSVNMAFTRLLGHDPSVVVGRPFNSFVDDGSAAQHALVCDVLRGPEHSVTVELMMRTSDGALRPIRFEFVDHRDDPVVDGVIASGYDISELRLVRQELEFIARHDPLTGLANRSKLTEHLDAILRSNTPVAVLFIDLDRFKPINDLYGHDVGDALLREVATRLHDVVRVGDIVARVGGDEFVALATEMRDWADARELADRVEASIGTPFLLDVGPAKIGASVGIALSDPSSTVASLLAAADVQMYHAKSERRGAARVTAIDRRRTAGDRRDLAVDLAVGLARGEVSAHLQPVVDLRTGAVVGMEALARWQHPRRGLLRPSAFIDLVDDAGLDTALGDAVLDSACRTLSEARVLGFELELGVNLSTGQLMTLGMTQRIAGILADHGFSMSALVVEITERSTLQRHVPRGCPAPEETLADLRASGAALSLDDFGTGESSLNHVRRFPLSSIKVDRTFVAAMEREREDHAVVEVVIGLARALGLSVIAEGVETDVQLQMLRALGCDRAQGYLLGEPMDNPGVLSWLRDRRRFGRSAGFVGGF